MSQSLEPPLGKTEDTEESDPEEVCLELPASLSFLSFRTSGLLSGRMPFLAAQEEKQDFSAQPSWARPMGREGTSRSWLWHKSPLLCLGICRAFYTHYFTAAPPSPRAEGVLFPLPWHVRKLRLRY